MGIMAGGAETTREEEVVYSEEVQERIDVALSKLGYSLSPPTVRGTARRVLEELVWKCVKEYE